MKGSSALTVFIGGALIGATLGVLFAPAKGEETRARIAEKYDGLKELLRKRGIVLSNEDLENLAGDIADEMQAE